MTIKATYEELEQRVRLLEQELIERRNQAEALQFTQFAVDHCSDAAFWIDTGTRVIYVNEAACRSLSYSREELLNMRIADFDPKFASGLNQQQWDELKKNGSMTIESLHRRKDGTLFPVEIVFNYLKFEGKEYNCSFARDISERKKAETLLHQGEEIIKSISRAAPLAIGMVVNRMFKQVNDRMCEMLGYSREELLGKDARMIYATQEDYEYVGREKYGQIKKFGIGTVETRWSRKDGEVIEVLLSSVPMDPKDGSVGVTFTALDITDRKRTEEKLRDSSERYQMLFSNVKDAVFVHQPKALDRPGTYIEVNDAACQIYGYTKEEFSKLSAWELTSPEIREQIPERIKRLFDEKHILFETTHVTKYGRRLAVETHSHLFEWKGRPTVLSIVRDITTRKKTEKSLRESEELLNSIVDSMTDGIVVLDRNYHITYWNKAMERISRVTHEKAMQDGKTAWKFFPGLIQKGIDNMIRQAMEGQVMRQDDIPYYLPDGTTVYTSETCTPLKSEDGEIRGVLSVVRDITEKKTLEARLQQAQKMEAIGTLAGGIAHDFNNILGIIVGNAELAIDDVPEWNPAHRNLQEIRKSCLRARDVVRQILSFSRQTEQKLEPINITPVIHESLKFLRSSLPSTVTIKHNLIIQKETVYSDPTQINQILINLSTNAAHAMREKGGTLSIDLENVTLNETEAGRFHELLPGEFVKMTVSDTGHGMPPHILDRIFDPYFTTKSIGEGTGLGLAVVHGIVQNHGGAIAVQSQPGKGSVFQIYLPLVEVEPVRKMDFSGTLPKGQESILFIDDEDAIVEMVQEMLQRLGYQIVCEQSPLKALELFQAQPDKFDLIITDMTMPQMLGTTLVKEMLLVRPEVPIILCTGFSEQINEEKALAIGVRAFMMKPIVMTEIAKIIRNVLDHDPG
jgi:PAS domain S-box-containing protein